MTQDQYLKHLEFLGRLSIKYKDDDLGPWQILGELPCGPGSAPKSSMPILKYVEGRYEDVIQHAIKLPEFFVFGYGGDIVKIEIEKI